MTTVLHPCLDENGKPVVVEHPTPPTSRDTWLDSRCSATLSRTAEPDLPDSVNGLAFTTNLGIPEEDPWYWRDVVPDAVTGEPDFVMPPGFRATSGCVVIEPDRRIWIVHPTNEFMGTKL